MRLKIDELLTLKTVVDYGGFNKAASILNKSQSSISQKISGLEEKIGTLLINREESCSCTEAGKVIYHYASMVEVKEKEIASELSYIINSAKPGIRMVIANASPISSIKDILYRFLVESNDFNFQLHIEPSRKIIGSIKEGCHDIGFGPFQSDMEEFVQVPIYEEGRYLVAYKGMDDIDRLKAGDLSALREKILIATFLDDNSDRPASKKLRSNFKLVWEVSEIGFREELISNGMGLGYVNEAFLKNNDEAIVLDKYNFGVIKKTGGFFYLKDHAHTVPFNHFLHAIKSRFADISVDYA